jgi:hypothetical protein
MVKCVIKKLIKQTTMSVKHILFVLLLVQAVGCTKSIETEDPDFDVRAVNSTNISTTSFNRGDTVRFIFSGNPDYLTFFSGEKGSQYDFRNRITDTSTNVRLSFSTALNTAGTSGTLSLLASTDLIPYTQRNDIDSINVNKATWTNITSRAVFATGAAATTSGVVDLSDFARMEKPVHLAFKYTAAAATTQRRWTISNISLRHFTADTVYTIDSTNLILPNLFPASATSPGWGQVNVTNPGVRFSPLVSTAVTTSFNIAGATAAGTAIATESFLVSGPIDMKRVLPDAGVAVKDKTTNASMSSYSSATSSAPQNANYAYRFMKAGIYKVTFVATNANLSEKRSVVKIIEITVQ